MSEPDRPDPLPVAHPNPPAGVDWPATGDLADVALLLTVILGTTLWIGSNATRHFDYFDMSAFLDAGYRVACGQRPYIDFFFNAGPVHPYLHALFFKIYGFNQIAVIAHLCLVNALFTTLAYTVARSRLPRLVAAPLAALASLAFLGPISHPWYDQTALLFVTLGLAAYELLTRRATEGNGRIAGAVLGVAAVLALLTKANIGAGAVILFAALALVGPRRRTVVVSFAVAAAITSAVAAATFAPPRPFVFQTLQAYGPNRRLLDLQRLRDVIASTPYVELTLVGLIIVGIGMARRRPVPLHLVIAFVGLGAFGLGGAWTGSLVATGYTAPLGLQVLYLAGLVASVTAGAPVALSRVVRVAAVAVAVVLAASTVRKTLDLEAWRWRPHGIVMDYRMQNQPFAGWGTNRQTGAGLDALVAHINRHVPRDAALFVFPDATFVYGLTGHESYRGAPFIFHLGLSPPEGPILERFRDRFMSEPPDWIALHHQTELDWMRVEPMLAWLRLDDEIDLHYHSTWQSGEFELLQRRDPPATVARTPATAWRAR